MLTCNNSLLDGINRHILSVATALSSSGLAEVAVCVTQPWGEFCEALAANGVRVFSLGVPNGHSFPILWRFWRVMRVFRPEVIHVHVLSLLVGFVARWAGGNVRYVFTVHGLSDPSPTRQSLRRWLGRRLAWLTTPRPSHVCYVSEGVRKILDRGDVPSSVVFNPIRFGVPERESKGVALRARLGLPTGVPVVGTACRIAKVKQPVACARVLCEVLRQNPMCHAVFLGAGERGLEEEVRKIVVAFGLSGRFHLPGYRPDAAEWVAGFDCFVLTSQREGMPGALLEAMSKGVPIAFFEGDGGVKDLVALNAEEGPFAVVAPQGDEMALARGIIALLREPSRAETFAKRAYEVGRQRFGIEDAVQRLMTIYREVLA